MQGRVGTSLKSARVMCETAADTRVCGTAAAGTQTTFVYRDRRRHRVNCKDALG